MNEKGYVLPFASNPRRLFRIGVNFSTKTRNIEEWKVE
ncbi:PD-(D/E)XK nuclease domain-containing protein [Parabacteroides goldsteinii]|nr:PD-(D/E)XK nuclease domain-containing protein [Parabacteroides goldsteinii]